MLSLKPGDLKWMERTLHGLEDDVTFVYFTEEANCRHCRQERELLEEVANLANRLHLEVYNFVADREVAEQYGVDKVPGVVLTGTEDYGVRYFGMPSAFEFRILLEDLIRVSTGDSELKPESRERLEKLESPVHLEVLTRPTCPFSTRAIRTVHQLAMESPLVTGDAVDLVDFPELVDRYNILAAPTVVVNESNRFYGALDEEEFIDEVMGALTETE